MLLLSKSVVKIKNIYSIKELIMTDIKDKIKTENCFRFIELKTNIVLELYHLE